MNTASWLLIARPGRRTCTTSKSKQIPTEHVFPPPPSRSFPPQQAHQLRASFRQFSAASLLVVASRISSSFHSQKFPFHSVRSCYFCDIRQWRYSTSVHRHSLVRAQPAAAQRQFLRVGRYSLPCISWSYMGSWMEQCAAGVVGHRW